MVAEAVREAEGRFARGLEEDEARLRGWGEGRGSSDEWNCAVQRMGEKRVLRWWRVVCEVLTSVAEGVDAAMTRWRDDIADLGIERLVQGVRAQV